MQVVVLVVLIGLQDCIVIFCVVFQCCCDLVVLVIDKIFGLMLFVFEGVFYVYIGCVGLIGKCMFKGDVLCDDMVVVVYFLVEVYVFLVFGVVYGLLLFFCILIVILDEILIEVCVCIVKVVVVLDVGEVV